MVELDEATRRALLAREGPPASARAEVLAGLRTRLGGPQGPSDPGEPELGGGESIPSDGGAIASSQMAWAAKVVGTTLGLAAAGVLTIKLGAMAVGSPRDQPAPTRTLPSDAAPQPVVAVEVREVDGEIVLSEPAAAVASSEGVAHRQRSAPAHNQAIEPDSTLAAELELVRAAKQLRADDPEAALAKLEMHRQRFPTGSLAPEREAMRVELLCRLGRRAAADEARSHFLEQHGHSPLRARVLASCEISGTDRASAGD
ncbi:MAG TPA: hypothetical protein VM869_32495, partial [Enhygromyxa sp.]|nr:hypothetical protein [Enhygromyxa sp.]